MKDTEAILKSHAKLYPDMTEIDAIKLLFQQEFGGGHIIESEEKSLALMKNEYDRIEKTDSLYIEDIGNGMTRVYLGGICPCALEAVNGLFVLGSREVKGSLEGFQKKLSVLKELTGEGAMPFDSASLEEVLSSYSHSGYPLVSHSIKYKQSYHPAYRVIPKRYSVLIELITEIEKRKSRGLQTVVAIDGQCGSGKTTIAKLLQKIYGASVVKMDDFFVPPYLRDEPHKKLPVHYERFEKEVLPNIISKQAFSYTAFDCSVMDYGKKQRVELSELIIVEGSYSLAPRFNRYYDISVYVRCSMIHRLERLKNRCKNEALMKRFTEEWIPTEDSYCEEFSVDKNADFIIET